jgi:hypothetical protein
MGEASKEIAGCWKQLYATLNVEESAKRRLFPAALHRPGRRIIKGL